MKKLINNYWIISIVALLMSLFSSIGIICVNINELIPKPEIPTEEEKFLRFWTFKTKEIDDLGLQLKVSVLSLGKKESQLRMIEERINAETIELNRIKDDINRLQSELTSRILNVEASEQKNLKSLASTYSNMAPDSVVTIFKEMNDNLIVKIMSFMSAEAVGPIFQSMANSSDKKSNWPRRAAKLSEIIRLNLTNKKTDKTTK